MLFALSPLWFCFEESVRNSTRKKIEDIDFGSETFLEKQRVMKDGTFKQELVNWTSSTTCKSSEMAFILRVNRCCL